MSHLTVWLVVGCLTGSLVGVLARANIQHMVLNVVSGMGGAWVAGWVMSPILGVSTLPQSEFVLNWASLAVAAIGAVMLLALAHLLRPDSPR